MTLYDSSFLEFGPISIFVKYLSDFSSRMGNFDL